MRRFVRDADLARGSDLTELDASQLRIARQQLHQAVGALEMVGMGAPAKVLRAMEALSQKFVQRPELCSDDAAAKVERASFALTEYLEGVLKGKAASSVALFPQYRAVMDLVGSERVHPADLWPQEWRWLPLAAPQGVAAAAYSPPIRTKMDQAVLKIVKTGSASAGRQMVDLCAGLAASQDSLEPKTFWSIAAGFFEAVALELIPSDVYSKRTASRILQQYATLAKGGTEVSERLAQDLAFYCSIAMPRLGQVTPVLDAVCKAYGFTRARSVNYEVEQFGRFDPALLVLARKRIASAAETWSALAGGDANRLKIASEQFTALADSVLKLHPECGELSRALLRSIDMTVQSGGAPSAAVGMEVATAVLYLEAAYEDLDPTESDMANRSVRLAHRLDKVSDGGEPEPLEAWMEDLYRRVSDRQTMGSVVDELRSSLGEVEASLDKFFRNPKDKAPLREVPSQLAQMRGVFSVLGLDQPSLAALRMRSSVEQFLVDDIDEASARLGIFDKLGNSLGAMGFLIDMLSYQRTLAKKLFVYDEALGEFKPLMGRERPEAPAPVAVPVPTVEIQPEAVPSVVESAAVAPAPALAPVAVPSPVHEEDADDDMELLDIFLEEAREVVQTGTAAVKALETDPSNLADQTTLRRAFHTLKGSSRMVGLNEFGEAAWSFEQLMNTWLAEQRSASQDLMRATAAAMTAFGRWVEDIGSKSDQTWNAADFRKASDGLRLDNHWAGLNTPAMSMGAMPVVEDTVAFTVAQAVEDEMPPAIAIEAMSFDLPLIEVPDESPSPAAVEPLELPAVELVEAIEVDFALDDVAAPEPMDIAAVSSAIDASSPAATVPDFAATQTADFALTLSLEGDSEAGPVVVEAPVALDLSEFDFGSLGEVEVDKAIAVVVDEPAPQVEMPEPHMVETALAPMESSHEEPVKVIGPLRLSIPLYNVYLNEADEWSRRLQVEISEWALELHEPLPDSLVALAHSLIGSSATVGFVALSELARSLEQALQHVQLHGRGSIEHAEVFSDASEDIRRLLHQFAAGFLKEADESVSARLQAVIETEFPAPTMESAVEQLLPEPEPFDLPEVVAEAEPEPEPVPLVVQATEPESTPELEVVDVPQAMDVELEQEAYLPPAEVEDLPVAAQIVTPDTDAPVDAHIEHQTAVSVFDMSTVLPAVSAAAAPLLVADAVDDDIDAVDNLDEDLFPIFEEEGTELLPQLGSSLRQWVGSPERLGARSEVLRVLHTLKGSARLAGAMRLGEMTHRMESAIEYLGSESLQTVQLEPLLTRFDNLQSTFQALGAVPEPFAESVAVDAVASVEVEDGQDAAIAVAVEAAQPKLPEVRRLIPLPAAAVSMPTKAVSNQSVRVRSQLLDRLVNQAGEVMITRSRMDARLTQLKTSLGELGGNLDRLRQQLRDVELQAESQMQSRLAQTKDTAQAFDPLEFDRFTRVQELTRMMAESVNDVATVQRNLQRSVEGTEDDLIAQGRQARELQRDLLRTRMVEFEAISERLYGVVRQASKDAGKSVKLDIVGGSIEMDRGVLDRMTPAFEHMLRNAVAHGIENQETRASLGKPAAGAITISVHQESNDVSVAFSDDGGGLNVDKIRAKAIANGVIDRDAALSDADAANLIFTPGFSTADQVTELSGRGVGMDIVRAEVSAVGGRIETSTNPGQGTSFKLVLPLTTAVTQVVMLRMGEFTIGVPSNLMETVLRVPLAKLEQAYERDGFEFTNEVLPFFWAGALLQVSARSHEMKTRTMPVAVLRSAGQRMALHVDEVLGNREVVVKNLGPQLARLPGLAGVSVLASGAVVLIYNPVALATVYGDQARQLNIAAPTGQEDLTISATMAAADAEVPLVLVVDDSITVRRVTQRLLKREGYRVALAADGLQALERLQEEVPAVVLSDIEMPRMDGFDLARNIRGDVRLRDLPIIMITSRIAEKHREHAKELGVDHYLGKPYSEDELMGLVRSYCKLPQNA
ncbi:MAG: hybrid sensor histidine kinase/response regulator [Burkholderiales bacterium PBB3]|nr:MAG: hybrid sensor histidine kinase/response regulator [Burkholderiales bacterium PBB3]